MLVLVLGAFICIPVIFVIVLKINGIKYLTDAEDCPGSLSHPCC